MLLLPFISYAMSMIIGPLSLSFDFRYGLDPSYNICISLLVNPCIFMHIRFYLQ